jgi:hypothetical protein
MRKKLLFTALILASNLSSAQENLKKCITTNLVIEELNNNPEYELMRQSLVNYQRKNKVVNKNQALITIPVVVHVVHRTSHPNVGSGTNISTAQIEDQLRVINEDFSKTNTEFPNPPRNTFINYAGNPELRFCLATIDPNGNPTTGITRTATSGSGFDADSQSNDMKQTSTGGIENWDPLRYLNIWVCNLISSGGGQTLGYAYLPGLQASSQSWKDGIVVDYQFFGTIGSANFSADGRTLTHEVGHYLGLNHTFCESGGCCDNDLNSQYSWGDVDDTPATEDIYFGSVNPNTNNNTCNDLSYSNAFNTDVIDMDENYMSYSADTWMFSNGQVDAMLGTLSASAFQGGRQALWQNSTVTVNCGNTIAVTWDCNAQGTCYDPGTGNGLYSSYSTCVNICTCIGQSPPISEGFESGSSLPADWSIINNDNDKTWEVTSLAGYNSSSSIYVNNEDYPANGEIDDLVLSTLDLSSFSSLQLSFDYAYTLWTDPNSNPNYSDTLQVLISSDCGVTWQQVWEESGLGLVTSTPTFTGSAWIPSNSNQWSSESVNLSNYINQTDVIIKFRNINDYENNLFLDNINISGTTNSQSWNCDENVCVDPGTGNGQYTSLAVCNNACISTSVEEIENGLYLYPNPADNMININYNGLKEIYNVLAEKVLQTYDNEINISNLSKGVYMIKVGNTNIRFIKK